jgi:hypothetical protein
MIMKVFIDIPRYERFILWCLQVWASLLYTGQWLLNNHYIKVLPRIRRDLNCG